MKRITLVVSSALLVLVAGGSAAKITDFRNWHFSGQNVFYDFGDVEARNDLRVGADLGVGGDSNVTGNSSVGKDLTVNGNTDLKGTAEVGDELTVKGDTDLNANANVGGDLTVKGFSSLEGGASIQGQLEVDDLLVNGSLTVSGGPTNLAGGLTVTDGATVDILTITGGADIAEPFAVTGLAVVEAGMVVSIDPERTGQLRVADQPYDRAVAGIISGAGFISSK